MIFIKVDKGPVNIYGNTGPGNLQRDRRLFWLSVRTGPPIILRVGSTGPRIISMLFFNGANDYLQVVQYGAIYYLQWCKLYGTNNYFSIFSRIFYGTKDYFPDFSTGTMIFLPFFIFSPIFRTMLPIFKTGMTSYLRSLIGYQSLAVFWFNR